MVGLLLFIFIAVNVFGWFFYGIYKIASPAKELEEWEIPAGRIHLFNGDRYFDSEPDNPYKHAQLDWDSGNLGVMSSDELVSYEEYKPALVGTIRIAKPESDKGEVVAIIDNVIAAALGLNPIGLTSLAWLTTAPNFH